MPASALDSRAAAVAPKPGRSAVLLLLLGGLAGCSGGAASSTTPVATKPDFSLRTVMFEVENLKRTIEPQIRNPAQLEQTTEYLSSALAWTYDGAWDQWVEQPFFLGDKQRFRAMRVELQGATQEARDAAAAGDMNGLRTGFVRMTMACIACHKRYQPNY